MLESIKGLNVVEKKGVPFLQFEIFKNQPVIHGFSTRLGGVSRGGMEFYEYQFYARR